MIDEKDVVVVSISDYSWKILSEKKFYAFPMGSRKIGKYFAFYKNGAISYYGEVVKSEEGGKNEVGIGYWLYCMPDAEPPFQLVEFDKIIKLRSPVKKEGIRGGHIQGTRYTTLQKLLKAKTISDLR